MAAPKLVADPQASPASSFDLTFSTQTISSQRDGNAVATESLEIAHEGFLDDAVTWTAIAMAESGGQTDSGYGSPSSFQIVSQGSEGGSRLFVGNLTVDSETTNAAAETDWLL
jgi:3-deoxy-D-arabino-heptulosonate 7-phosphate (DAHP) synthase